MSDRRHTPAPPTQDVTLGVLTLRMEHVEDRIGEMTEALKGKAPVEAVADLTTMVKEARDMGYRLWYLSLGLGGAGVIALVLWALRAFLTGKP